MNEQMYELLSQARNQPVDVVKQAPHGSAILTPVQLEKFAELIVQECISIVDDAERGGSNEVWDNAVKFIRRDLQEHFGVEE